MKYALTRLTLSETGEINLTESEYQIIKDACRQVSIALAVEELFQKTIMRYYETMYLHTTWAMKKDVNYCQHS